MKDHNKKIIQYLLKGQLKIVFNINQDCKYVMTDMINNTTKISWSNYLRDAISKIKDEGYHLNYIAEMNFKTVALNCDMTYDFYLKHKVRLLN